jgi:hypothetical protein
VLGAVQSQGESAVRSRLEAALQTGAPLCLALKPPEPEPPRLADDALPDDLRRIQVVAARAADFDVLLGGDR